MSSITCENLTISWEGKAVIKDLSFGIEDGDFLCIVGDNGSGKTTLVKTLLGLKKPDSGQIVYAECGCPVGSAGPDECKERHRIGYLPQKTEFQKDFPASVREIVLSGCLNGAKHKMFFSREDKKTAADAMERLGIGALKKASFADLSGGQQQRVLLARALCATRDFLFLDEPVSGLDPVVTRDMYELIRELNDSGITIVMISHDIEAAVSLSKHILHLSDKVEFFGTTEDYRNTEICEHYLCHIAEHLHHGDDCELCAEEDFAGTESEHVHLHRHAHGEEAK